MGVPILTHASISTYSLSSQGASLDLEGFAGAFPREVLASTRAKELGHLGATINDDTGAGGVAGAMEDGDDGANDGSAGARDEVSGW